MWRNGCPHGNRDERVPLTRGHLSIAGEVTAPPTALDRAKRHPEMVLRPIPVGRWVRSGSLDSPRG